MYVAKDAVAQLAGTLPQRAVVPCFVRGARLRVCVRVSALRVCVCVAVWAGFVAVRVVCRVLRPLRTPGRPRAGAVARVPFGRCHIHALRATWTSASRFEVRGRRVCRLRCYVCVRVCACVVSCCPACILLIVPVAAPAILSFSMRVLCVFIEMRL